MGFFEDLNKFLGSKKPSMWDALDHGNVSGVSPIISTAPYNIPSDQYKHDPNNLEAIIQKNPGSIYVQTLDLSVAQTVNSNFSINVPGKSFVVYGFTTGSSIKTRNTTAFVEVRLDVNLPEKAFPAKSNRGYKGEFTKLFLNWPAQAGVSMDVVIHQFNYLPWEQDLIEGLTATVTGPIAVTQSGVWSVGRTWTLNSGTDSVSSVQSGDWTVAVNNFPATQPVSGTVAVSSVAGNVAVQPTPGSASTLAPTNSTSTAYEASRVIKAAAGNFYSVVGYNSKTSTQFIQIHDAAALPANGAVPSVIFAVPASSSFSYTCDAYPRNFSTGMVICNSSTGPTKTIGAADCWFDVQFS